MGGIDGREQKVFFGQPSVAIFFALSPDFDKNFD